MFGRADDSIRSTDNKELDDKKINLIEELRKFDREEQMKMESYMEYLSK